ncbi:FkbM family methyltransferase [Nitrosopumilus piranensis]|uniref:Methyltransferase FkbM domain-containing protein n=1 Tax=Nitrosopumilus piranensis TaxID=1582439 RepID=A0A0C5BNH0_9ARCH|nr:FkbM family methyltransferase [Nitrosopumilus piranensis]AJM91248.1 hypothetical protein NPIRD3C_0024 [Nitrosopumilus piranensis]
MSDLTQQITKLYELFLDRTPNQVEIDYWNNQIDSGLNFEGLFNKIKFSKEAELLELKKQAYDPKTETISITLAENTLSLDCNDKVAIETYLVVEYEPGTTNFLKKILKKGMNVINIGANIGYFTLLAARQIGPEGKVFAFEPFPKTVELLKKNIDSNGFQNVQVESKAVSNKTDFATLLTGGSSLHNFISKKKFPQLNEIKVPTITVDDFLKNEKKNIDLIFIDAEGQEPLIFEGMKNTLENKNIDIVFEYNPFTLNFSDTTPDDLLDPLSEMGFQLYMIDENTSSLKSISKSELIKQIIPPQVANVYLTRKSNI